MRLSTAASALFSVCALPSGIIARTYPPKFPGILPCDPTRCICTGQQFIDVFKTTTNLTGNSSATVPVPGACVNPQLVGRILSLRAGQKPQSNTPIAGSVGFGSWLVFSFDSTALQNIIVQGQFKVREILSDLGFGPVEEIECNSTKTNFYLTIWEDTTYPNKKKPDTVRGTWVWLQPFLEKAYGKDLSWLTPAFQILERTRFTDLTGCPIEQLSHLQDRSFNAPYNTTNLLAIGCNPIFAEAAQTFRNYFTDEQFCVPSKSDSAAKPATALYYKKNVTYCVSDKTFFKMKKQNYTSLELAIRLRAYGYSRYNFNQFYAGYGFTSNDYETPLYAEYWRNNALLSDVGAVTLSINCDNELVPPGFVSPEYNYVSYLGSSGYDEY